MRTIEELELASKVFSEIAYNYFELLEKEGNEDFNLLVEVDETNVFVQLDKLNQKLVVTVPDTTYQIPDDPVARAEFPMQALMKVAVTFFTKGIEEQRGNGSVVIVDGSRYNVWLDEETKQIRFNMDAEDRRKLEDD